MKKFILFAVITVAAFLLAKQRPAGYPEDFELFV